MDASYALGSAGGTAQNLSNTDVTSVDNSNLVLISVDNALQQLATSSAQLGAYQNRFQAAITGLNTTATNLSEREELDRGHELRPGHLEPLEGADSAAGRHLDGGAGQHDPAEHSDAAAEAAVSLMHNESATLVIEGRAGAARRPPSHVLVGVDAT